MGKGGEQGVVHDVKVKSEAFFLGKFSAEIFCNVAVNRFFNAGGEVIGCHVQKFFPTVFLKNILHAHVHYISLIYGVKVHFRQGIELQSRFAEVHERTFAEILKP